MFALLEVLQYYCPNGGPCDDDGTLPELVSVTSQRCKWGPQERNVQPQTILQTVVEKSNVDNERQKNLQHVPSMTEVVQKCYKLGLTGWKLLRARCKLTAGFLVL